MFYFKLSITSLLIITYYGLVSASAEDINKQDNNEQLNKTVQQLVQNVTNSRSARTLLSPPRTPTFTLRRRQPIKIRARADHLPLRSHMRRVQSSLPNGQPQQQSMRFGFESLKSSKYIPSSKGANLPFSNNGKGSSHRPQLLGGHPNSIHVPALSQQYIHNFKASPTFNGQVMVYPVSQTQKQQPTTTQQQDNSYPKYIKPQQQAATNAVSSQLQTQKQQQQQHHQHHHHHEQQQQPALAKYPDFKQYPIPDHEKMQQHNELHEKYLQQQKFLNAKNPMAYYQLQHTQQQQQHEELHTQPQPQQSYTVQQPLQYLPQSNQQQPSIPIHESVQANGNNKVAFPAAAAVPPKMYSVYEENDMTELQTNNDETATYHGLDKEAQEYIRFMNSDEYFLPKKDPNYKQIDDETDKRQYNVLKAQTQHHLHALQQSQPHTHYQQSPSQLAAYQQHVYTPSSSSPQSTQYSKNVFSDPYDASAYNQGISRLFYQQDPPTAASASSTVLRTSYQTGYNQNQFVVSSQDNKIGKYTIPPASTPSNIGIPTQPPVVYPQLRHNRTPEPLRFEFTERDAMVGGFAYTNSPQNQLKYKEFTSNSVTPKVSNEETSTISLVKAQNYLNAKHAIKPVVEESEDDPEDDEDVQEAGTSLYGRQPLSSSNSNANKPTSTTEAPPSEQKDTEDYCERICAIVEDENEEIVCGSDGYMYTSESQMECYASCLRIDVTIQGKGSCSKR